MDASSIRWPVSHYDRSKSNHDYRIGDNAIIARLSPHILTSPEIIGHRGTIIEVDDISMSSVEMHCHTCGSIHTMHEAELDYLGNNDMAELRSKADLTMQLEMEPVTARQAAARSLEDAIAVAMHQGGFLHPAVEDRSIPMCDPDLPQPIWAKYAYGTIWRLAPFKVFHAALVDAARSVDGHLVEWCSFSMNHGWQVLTAADMETLTLEMPIRASLQSRLNDDDRIYGETKQLVSSWLQDKHQIDIGAIYRAVRDNGWTMGNWQYESHNDNNSYSFDLAWPKGDGNGWETFVDWAKKNWIWVGHFSVYVEDAGTYRSRMQSIEIMKEDGSAQVEVVEQEDVPF